MTTLTMSSPGPEATLELLWRRIRERGNLPGFSRVINALNETLARRDDHNLSITKTVLSDPALTQRVLRLANSAMYSVFGHGISTVSKAVMVLGTESIAHLAMGMKLIDDLSTMPSSSRFARSEMDKAVLAGHIARQITAVSTSRDDEEAVVCALLHNLGKLMVTFYLPEKWAAVQNRKITAKVEERKIAHEVLGIGLEEISRLVAERWKLPKTIVNTLAGPDAGGEGGEPGSIDRAAWLSTIAAMSSQCADVVNESSDDPERLSAIADSYATVLGIETAAICAAVKTASMIARKDAQMLQARAVSSPSRNGLPSTGSRRQNNTVEILLQGVADMSEAGPATSTGQLLTIALETLHQGLCTHHAIAFLRNRAQERYTARMLLGDDSHGKLSGLSFPDRFESDVFHAALASDKIVYINNARDVVFASKLPAWWRGAMRDAQSFVILPLMIQDQPIGFLYGDWQTASPDNQPDDTEIATLNEMRSLIVRSAAQRR